MKSKLFYISIFSLFLVFGYGQENGNVEVQSGVKDQKPSQKKDKKTFQYQPNFLIGFDVLHAGLSFFNDQKMYQGFVSSRITQKMHAVADLGIDRNIYAKNGYDVHANGIFAKLGVLYMMNPDPENFENGFYVGGKIAGSFYNQEMKSIPIRWIQGQDSYASFPSSSQSSYWIEAALGGRIEILGSNFFIDVQAQPKYLVYTSKQENIYPMVIPGFGKDATKFKIGFSWSVAYKF